MSLLQTLKFYAAFNALLVPLMLIPNTALSQQSDEYTLKAVMLFKMARFVKWAEEDLPQDGQIKLCIIGQDPFGSALDQLQGQKIQGRSIHIEKSKKEVPASCNIAYLGANKDKILQLWIEECIAGNILSIGDQKDFAARGGIINMVRKNNRIGFEVNTQTAKESELKISSKLLKLANIVNN